MKTYVLTEKPGETMAIIVDELSSEDGVLVLLDRKEKEGLFVILKNEHKEEYLPIVTLRQPPELCGIEESDISGEERGKWIIPHRVKFCNSLQKSIKKSNIKKLLVVSGAWTQEPYADAVRGIRVKEVKENIVFS